MKKSLFALAAVTAFAGAAQAQSSVTVYGLMDVGYIGGNSRVSSSAIRTNGGTTKTTVNQFGQGAESTSRLGFKGTEVLGGGMSAFFTAEFELYPNDQDLSGNTRGGLRNRQSFVGLQKTGLGKAAVGTQYTPVFTSGAATSPGQFNNVIGDIIYAGAPAVSVKGFDNAGTNSASMTNRTSNTLTVASDKFSGFGVNAMYTLANQNVSQTASTAGGNTNANGWGLGADFTYNKFYVTAAYQALKQLTTASNNGNPTLTTSTPWTSAQPSATILTGEAGNALNVQDNQFLAGATYDFGILKAYAQYISRKATATQSSNYYVKRSGEQIGVRSFITPKIEAWASAGLGRYTTFGANQPTANMNAWQLGTNYLLSKRTNLYAIYGQQLTSTAASGTTSGSSGASQYAIGVRHTF